jgi:hypothetical protein
MVDEFSAKFGHKELRLTVQVLYHLHVARFTPDGVKFNFKHVART